MGFSYLKNSKIDRQKWDECINTSLLPQIYAYSWYLDLSSPGWDALVDDEWTWVMPIPKKLKYGIPVILQPMFSQQLGVFSSQAIPPNLMVLIINTLKYRFPYINYHFNRQNPIPEASNFFTRKQTFELSMNSDYSDLEKNFSKSHARNLKIVKSSGIQISESAEPDEFIKMLCQMYVEKSVSSLKPYHYAILKKISEFGISTTNSKLYYASGTNGKLIGSALFLRQGRQMVQFMARTDEGFKSRTAFLLVNQLLVELAGNDVYLDFAGSNIPGVAEFNRGWGATHFSYPHYNNRWF